MSVLMLFTLAACKRDNEFVITAVVLQAIDAEIGLPSETTTNLTLKTEFTILNDVEFTAEWTSGNPSVISNSGVVTRPSAETGDVTVVMSAFVVLAEDQNQTATRTYSVIVRAMAPTSYTVTFNSNGGSTVAAITANAGGTITAPTAPTRAGFTFDGWYKESALTTPWNFAIDTVTANTTLYAKWTAIPTYTVTFDPDNGSGTTTQTVVQNGFATQPANPVKLGYMFVNWQTTVGTVWNFATSPVTANVTLVAQYEMITYTITYVIPEGATLSGTGFTTYNVTTLVDDLGSATLANHEFLGWFTEAVGGTKVTGYPVGTTGNQTLYAQFEEDEKYTVTFNDGIGGIETVSLYYGYVDIPEVPVREGYTFGGWYKDTDFIVLHDFEFDIISADITLYAKWTRTIPEGYTAIYTVEEFYQMTLSSSTGGFFLMNDLDFANYTWVAHNNSFRGIFDGDGHTLRNLSIISAVAGNYGGIFPRANGATIQNFTVDNITIDAQNRAGIIIGRVENGKVQLQDLSITKSRVMGTANEGVGLLIGQVSFETDIFNVSITESEALSTNKYASLLIGRADHVVFASDIFIADSFAEITATNTDAGAAGVVAYTNHANANVTVSNLVILDSFLHGKYAGAVGGYQNLGQIHVSNAYINVTFTYTDAPNSGLISRVVSTAGTTMNFVYVDLVLEKPMHAQALASTQLQRQPILSLSPQFWTDNLSTITTSVLWELNTPVYQLKTSDFTFSKPTVTYNPNGGSQVSSLRLIPGMNAFITGTTTRDGFIFDGWFKDEALTVPFDFANEVILVDTTIYAKWTEIEKFTVTFNSNGGSAVSPFTEVLDGSTILAPTAPSRDGFTFAGWYKDVELTQSFGFGSEQITANITIYAKWDAIVYTITYVLFDGSYPTMDVSYTILTPTITFDEASKVGYDFLGWFDLPSGGNAVTGIPTGSMGNVTVYAQYQPIGYAVVFVPSGGTVDPEHILFNIETPTFQLPIPQRDGYFFIGWYLEGELYTEVPQGSIGNRVYTAEWSELIEINFYDFLTVDAENYMFKYFDGMYTEYAFYQGELFGKGDNAFGHLANGSNMPSENWIHMTPFFNLNPGEEIVHYFLDAPTFMVITSDNRILVWGFMGFDGETPEFILSPTDVTQAFNLNGAEVEYVAHLFFTILVQTSDLRILAFAMGQVVDVTPVLLPGETITWSLSFGGDGMVYSNVFYTGERIFIFPFMSENPAFIDLTDAFNFETEEVILAIFSQGGGVHVITDLYYRFAMLTEDEENPIMAIAIDIDLTLLPGETIVSTFGGGGLFTSENRIFLPVYVVDEMNPDFPYLVVFHEITSSLDLEVGEEILSIFDPFFIITTTGRLLLVIPDENFTLDPFYQPVFDVLEVTTTSLGETEMIIMIDMTSGDPIVVTNTNVYIFSGDMDGITLEKITLEVIGLIHTDIYPMIDLDLFVPEDRPYHDFGGWFLDPELTLPFDPEEAYDGMNLYAKWHATHYLIKFELGQDLDPIAPIYVEFGLIAEEPILMPREHYEFSGWYYYDAFGFYHTYDFSTPLDQNVTLYPLWVSKTYEVTLEFDLVEDFTVVYGSAYMELQWLSIYPPEGYDILGIYLDEEMTTPWNPNAPLLGNMTLYVALEPQVINIYYYYDIEAIQFVTYFNLGDAVYAITADDRIFVWGYNGNGGLGIGFEGLLNVGSPFDMTDILNLAPGEMIEQIYAQSSTKVLTTTEGRVFMWGFPDANYNYYHTPQDITSVLGLSPTDLVVFAHPLWGETYFLTLEGKLIVFEYYSGNFYTFETEEMFSDVLALAQFGSNSYIVIETSRVFILNLDMDFGTVMVQDQSYFLDGSMIIGKGFDYETYTYDLFFTSSGLIFKYSPWASIFSDHGSITLNPGEVIVDMYELYGTYLFVTSDDRMIYYVMGTTGVVDLTNLGVGQYFVGAHQSMLYTNLGYVYMIDQDYVLQEGIQAFYLDESVTIVDLIVINHNAHGLTSEGDIIHPTYAPGTSYLTFYIGTNLVVEQVTFGEMFEYAVPEERIGYAFEGWYPDTYFFYPEFGEPTHDLILYAAWAVVME